MPSNKELQAEIAKVSPGTDTDGLTNAQLQAKLDEARKPAADTDEAPKKKGYRVAEGKSMVTKRGILNAGDEIKADDFAGGEDVLKGFVKSGHIVK